MSVNKSQFKTWVLAKSFWIIYNFMGIPNLYAPGNVYNSENPIVSKLATAKSHLFQKKDGLLSFFARGPGSGDLRSQMILVLMY